MKKIHYLNAVNFLSAFLLFQIELIIAKILLPKFGGSYLVWGACMVFFQCTLLLGYLYSHVLIKKIGVTRYRYFHMMVILVPLLFFPGRPLPDIYAHHGVPMVLDVFEQLLLSISLVFFVLSTTSVISQSWLSASELSEKSNPYVLYAVSNLGSFLALLSYPFFFEERFDLGAQLNIWRACYLLLLGFYLIAFRAIGVTDTHTGEEAHSPYRLPAAEKVRWFLFSAAGVIAFLSVTNIITYEIAPAPLLWIIPLCIYLISFVLNFKREPFCPEWIKNKFHLTIAFSILLFFLTQKRIFPFLFEIAAYSFSLYCMCMFCQNEIIKNKPKDARGLTVFYLVIAAGSFLGGVLVSWIMPLVSTSMIEYLLGILIINLALTIGKKSAPITLYYFRLIVYVMVLLFIWPQMFPSYNIFGLIAIFLLFKLIYTELKSNPHALYLNILSILLVVPCIEPYWAQHEYIHTQRNYYGIYKIYDERGVRFLINGTTLHGGQFISQKKRMDPVTYYHRLTPIGKLMESDAFHFHTIGVVGLGTGTIAAYGRAGQVIDFFELDPDALTIATRYFTFLKESASKINYIIGDARISLGKAPQNRYDLLVVDAFSGDSVPIHLLTTEAISEYKKHITQDGIILFHVSNRYLNLVPVLFSNAKALHAYPGFDYNVKPPQSELSASVWVALTWSDKSFEGLTSKLKWRESNKIDRRKLRYIRPWTDQYSSILPVLKLEQILESIRIFQPFYW